MATMFSIEWRGFVEFGLLLLYVLLGGFTVVFFFKKSRQAKGRLRVMESELASLKQEVANSRMLEAEFRRKQVEDRAFFYDNPYPMWVFEEQGFKFMAVNDAALHHYGYSREEFLEMTILDIGPPEESPTTLDFRQWLQDETVATRVCRQHKKDGTLMDVKMTAHKLNFQGNPAWLILALDVTAEYRARQALLRQKERFQLLSESAADLLFALEPPAVIEKICLKITAHTQSDLFLNFLSQDGENKVMLHSWAGLPEELARRLTQHPLPIDELLCHAAVCQCQPLIIEDMQSYPDPKAESLRNLGIRAYICLPLHPNGRLLGTLAFGSRTQKAFGEDELELFSSLSRYLAIALDRWHLLKEAREQSAQLQTAQEQLQRYTGELEVRVAERTAKLAQSLRSLEGVLYHVAHDLRAPLRALHGFTELLIRNCSPLPTEATADYARRLTEASKRMDRLIHDLLLYGRLGHQQLVLDSIDLGNILNDVLHEWRATIQAKKAIIQVSQPLPRVTGDGQVIRQVLYNLLSNALKFVARPPAIRVWAEAGYPTRLYMEDNGIGIAAEHQNKIFGIFERLHSEEEFPGTGIGLAIVKKGMERMGGNVKVESEVGRGSRFCLEFNSAY